MEIREYRPSDWGGVWCIIEPVFRAGETYALSTGISEQDAHGAWIETPRQTFVVIDENDRVVGTYYIKPNQAGPGAHVCNCGYIVSAEAQGRGVASGMCEHSQSVAVDSGFRAMQFNLVVATNEGAIRLWKKLGFTVIGVLPEAYNSRSRGFVDALVMYKQLLPGSSDES